MRIWLPETLKRPLRPLPQWAAIALRGPQEAVDVRIAPADGDADTACRSVVAALRPFTLAVHLDDPVRRAIEDGADPQLRFVDRESRRILGVLFLRRVGHQDLMGEKIGLFEVRHGRHQCVRWPRRPWNRSLQNRSMRKNVNPGNFSMPPDSVQHMMIFYICPRPVVLVSVDDGAHSNVFPMDLIGAIAPDHFALALRSTSQSIATMKSARRVALADIAAKDRAVAYQLGIHHKNIRVDWERLPFKIQRSRLYSLPCPETALRVRELDILSFETIGSHTFFVASVASDQPIRDDEQLFHTSGIYQEFRSRHGFPFQPAP